MRIQLEGADIENACITFLEDSGFVVGQCSLDLIEKKEIIFDADVEIEFKKIKDNG